MSDWLSGNFAWGSVCCSTESAGGIGLRRVVVLDCFVEEIGPYQNWSMKRLLMPLLYVLIAGKDNGQRQSQVGDDDDD
eukprot:4790174-Ditylum_brightwellii.AAC.1